ncbi:putative prolyl 4-hydroxylase [Trifolium repens]|nr:putative prolyl 4-hydroxylase [Trifolium repens]
MWYMVGLQTDLHSFCSKGRKGETAENTKGIRTSSGVFISASEDKTGTLDAIEEKIARATMIPRSHGEEVVEYSILNLMSWEAQGLENLYMSFKVMMKSGCDEFCCGFPLLNSASRHLILLLEVWFVA